MLPFDGEIEILVYPLKLKISYLLDISSCQLLDFEIHWGSPSCATFVIYNTLKQLIMGRECQILVQNIPIFRYRDRIQRSCFNALL